MSSTVGRRYAKALLALATEQGQVEKIERDLTDLAKSWEESRELRGVFESPDYSQQMRRSVVDALASRAGMSPTLKNTLCLLSDRRRMRFLPHVADAFRALSEEKAGRVRAEVVTASSMPDSYFNELRAALERVTGRSVILEKRADPSIIGGVVARVGDKVFDGSLKTRLDELRDELLEL